MRILVKLGGFVGMSRGLVALRLGLGVVHGRG